MPTHYSMFGQLLLHILADYTGLNAGHHVVLIHPLDFVHPRHINRHYTSLLVGVAHQRLSHVCSSSERNQHHVMHSRCLDQLLRLLVAGDVDHIIDSSRHFGSSQQEEFLQGVAVRVEDTRHLVGVDLVNFALDGFNKTRVLKHGIGRDLALRFDDVADIDADHSLRPVLEFGHLQAGELISATCDLDDSIIADEELRVLEAPSIVLEPLLLVFDRLPSLHPFQRQRQILQPLHLIQTIIGCCPIYLLQQQENQQRLWHFPIGFCGQGSDKTTVGWRKSVLFWGISWHFKKHEVSSDKRWVGRVQMLTSAFPKGFFPIHSIQWQQSENSEQTHCNRDGQQRGQGGSLQIVPDPAAHVQQPRRRIITRLRLPNPHPLRRQPSLRPQNQPAAPHPPRQGLPPQTQTHHSIPTRS